MTKKDRLNLYYSKSKNIRVKIVSVASSGLVICKCRNKKYYKTKIEDLVHLY